MKLNEKFNSWRLAAALLCMAAIPVCAYGQGHQTMNDAKYFAFVTSDSSDEWIYVNPNEFIIKVTDPVLAGLLQLQLSGELPQPTIAFKGVIALERAPYNEQWPFHVIPESIEIPSSTIEVCDARPQEIEEHLHEVGGAFLPDNEWCPWTMRLSRRVRR
jgi:hypothetical protein